MGSLFMFPQVASGYLTVLGLLSRHRVINVKRMQPCTIHSLELLQCLISIISATVPPCYATAMHSNSALHCKHHKRSQHSIQALNLSSAACPLDSAANSAVSSFTDVFGRSRRTGSCYTVHVLGYCTFEGCETPVRLCDLRVQWGTGQNVVGACSNTLLM
jgi:hypothetical protein